MPKVSYDGVLLWKKLGTLHVYGNDGNFLGYYQITDRFLRFGRIRDVLANDTERGYLDRFIADHLRRS